MFKLFRSKMGVIDNLGTLGILYLILLNSIKISMSAAGSLKQTSQLVEHDVELHSSQETDVENPSSSNYASSPTKRRKGISYAPGVQNYYDLPSPYLGSKYMSDPIEIPMSVYGGRGQRYTFPEYVLPDMELAARRYSVSDSSLEPLASGSHHNSYGHSGDSHGGSHGRSHGDEYGLDHLHRVTKTNYAISAVNSDAIGLLGLLDLLALLQSVLPLFTTTRRLADRKKRGAPVDTGETNEDNAGFMDDVLKRVVASFNIIAHAQTGKVGFNCTQTETCRANQIITQSLGERGRIASRRITNRIKEMLGRVESNPEALESIMQAAVRGRMAKTEKDCETAYPFCKDLEIDGVYSLPSLLPASHPLYYDYKEKTQMNE